MECFRWSSRWFCFPPLSLPLSVVLAFLLKESSIGLLVSFDLSVPLSNWASFEPASGNAGVVGTLLSRTVSKDGPVPLVPRELLTPVGAGFVRVGVVSSSSVSMSTSGTVGVVLRLCEILGCVGASCPSRSCASLRGETMFLPAPVIKGGGGDLNLGETGHCSGDSLPDLAAGDLSCLGDSTGDPAVDKLGEED